MLPSGTTGDAVAGNSHAPHVSGQAFATDIFLVPTMMEISALRHCAWSDAHLESISLHPISKSEEVGSPVLVVPEENSVLVKISVVVAEDGVRVAIMHAPSLSANPGLHSLHTSSPVQILLKLEWHWIKFSTLHRAQFAMGYWHTSDAAVQTTQMKSVRVDDVVVLVVVVVAVVVVVVIVVGVHLSHIAGQNCWVRLFPHSEISSTLPQAAFSTTPLHSPGK